MAEAQSLMLERVRLLSGKVVCRLSSREILLLQLASAITKLTGHSVSGRITGGRSCRMYTKHGCIDSRMLFRLSSASGCPVLQNQAQKITKKSLHGGLCLRLGRLGQQSMTADQLFSEHATFRGGCGTVLQQRLLYSTILAITRWSAGEHQVTSKTQLEYGPHADSKSYLPATGILSSTRTPGLWMISTALDRKDSAALLASMELSQ